MDSSKREIWIDWMRVAACLMVMLIHACEPFYPGAVSAWIRSVDLPTPVKILSIALITFAGAALLSVLVQRIPRAGRLIIG